MAFIFGCFHDEQHVQWCEEHCESTEPESRQKAKMFFFFFFFKRAGSKFCDSFMIVFTQNSSILHWAVHQPIALTLKSDELVQTGHWTTMASFAMPFSSLVCMHINHLAMKCNYYIIILETAELETRLCSWRQGSVIHWLGWTEPGQWFFSQYCINLLRKPVRTDLLLCDTIGALNLRHKINNYFSRLCNIRKYLSEKLQKVTHD